MTFDEWVYQAEQYKLDHPEQRAGQAYFNYLHEVRPDIARKVHCKYPIDPFFNDGFIPLFLNKVGGYW